MSKYKHIASFIAIAFSINVNAGEEALSPPPIQSKTITDTVLIEKLENGQMRAKSESYMLASTGSWNDLGADATVSTAKELYISEVLIPGVSVPNSATISTVDYFWSDSSLNGWDQYFESYLIAYKAGNWYTLGPLPSNSDNVSLPPGYEAGRGLYFGYYVNAFYTGAPLNTPPSVSWNSASVSYNY